MAECSWDKKNEPVSPLLFGAEKRAHDRGGKLRLPTVPIKGKEPAAGANPLAPLNEFLVRDRLSPAAVSPKEKWEFHARTSHLFPRLQINKLSTLMHARLVEQ